MIPPIRHALAFLLVCVGASAVLMVAVQQSTAPFIYSNIGDVPTAQVALVPGASVIGTSTLSHVLQERADMAALLYGQHKVQKILVTGDNGELSHNEVDPVGKYLAARGIPKSDIFLDHAGFDTYSSMFRARDVFDVHSVIIVSQPFHLPRAVYIARAMGLSAVGLPAGTGESYAFNQMREIPATLKAVLNLAFKRSPKYLGDQIPVSGSASSTWPGI